MRWSTRLWVCGLLTGAVWAGQPDVLRIGNGPEPETLDPHRAEGVSAGNILRDLYEGLTALAPDGRPIPAAARAWEVSEDGRVYRFRLRGDLRWSNGEALTAEDFAASLRRSVTPATGSAYAQILAPIRNARAIIDGRLAPDALAVRAEDPLTLRIELEAPAPYLPGLFSHPVTFPVHRTHRQASGRFTQPGELISNGAYRLDEWVVNAHVGLVRNPYYHDAANVAIERVRYLVTEDVHSELKRYRAGELDVTYEVPPSAVKSLRRDRAGELRIAPYLGLYFYGLNVTRAPFAQKPEVRRALSMVIDRELIVDKVLYGLGMPAYGWVVPGTAGSVEQRPEWANWPYARRVAEAQRLYRAAGYSDVRPLETEIRYNTHDGHRRVATVVAAMWKQTLGVRTRLVNEEFKVFLHHRRLRRDTQVYRAAWMADFNDPLSFLGILHTAHGKNDTGWRNARYDDLLDQAALLTDTTVRAQKLRQAERIVLDEVPAIPLYFYVSKHLVSPRVQGWTDHLLDYHYSKDLRLVPSIE
ncbi:oligopeptide transport system substrate-binding protein [Fontimonas thermophila]|uniref:Oligopeptide transport system substrate-binding protein n=1 Tax=Fontimonas thermophila TaxID=1076937 RepID=A0A1I2JW77_9GAMM|nr:peptide ABC transporter substrate-binding protein [Fontimonas thermophila]SFF58449.1 oligopeptide transport system substrate-binding protein [Fontimonas thermophila]